MKLIILPLVVMVFLGLLSFYGLHPTSYSGAAHPWFDSSNPLVYNSENMTGSYADSTGRVVAFANRTIAVDDANWTEPEGFPPFTHDVTISPYLKPDRPYSEPWTEYWFYVNGTDVFAYPVHVIDNTGDQSFSWIRTFSSGGQLGVIGLVTALAIFAFAVGFRFMSSGTSETSVQFIVVSVGLSALWLFVSSLAFGLIGELPMNLGQVLWLSLTLLYALGMFQLGIHGSGD